MRYDTYMSLMYATVSTKGQVTIPALIRQKFGIVEGRRVGFRVEGDAVSLEIPSDIESVRTQLQGAMRSNGTLGVPYSSGDGWAAHVAGDNA